jgi:chromosome partitioning protein
MVEWIEAAFDDVPVWRVRERADIQNALDECESLVAHNPDSDQVPVFDELAASLEEQFGVVAA